TTATERSAADRTEVMTDAVLFAETRSDEVEATVALLDSVVDSLGACTVIVMVGGAPTRSDGRVQVTSCPLALHVQPLPVALTKATLPGGRLLLTVMPEAVFGPRLLTSIA